MATFLELVHEARLHAIYEGEWQQNITMVAPSVQHHLLSPPTDDEHMAVVGYTNAQFFWIRFFGNRPFEYDQFLWNIVKAQITLILPILDCYMDKINWGQN